MSDFLLSDDAVLDLEHIYRQGLDRFGQDQADKYLDEFYDLFDLLSRNPDMGTLFDVQDVSFRRHPHKAHVIIFDPS